MAFCTMVSVFLQIIGQCIFASLILEGASPKEFPEQRSRWEFLVGDWFEESEKFCQCCGQLMFRPVFIYRFEQRYGIVSEYGELIDECAVEHGVRILLERENPFLFPSPDRRPSGNGADSGGSPVLVVAHDSPDEPVVGCRDVVVVVELDGGQCRDVNPEDILFRYFLGYDGVERMDSLHHEDGVVVESELLTAFHALSQGKIVAWKFDFLSFQQQSDMLLEKFDVERLNVFVVEVSALIFRCVLPIHEIIVERDELRHEPVGHELHGKPLAECGLSA